MYRENGTRKKANRLEGRGKRQERRESNLGSRYTGIPRGRGTRKRFVRGRRHPFVVPPRERERDTHRQTNWDNDDNDNADDDPRPEEKNTEVREIYIYTRTYGTCMCARGDATSQRVPSTTSFRRPERGKRRREELVPSHARASCSLHFSSSSSFSTPRDVFFAVRGMAYATVRSAPPVARAAAGRSRKTRMS